MGMMPVGSAGLAELRVGNLVSRGSLEIPEMVPTCLPAREGWEGLGEMSLPGDGDSLRDDADVAGRRGLILSPAEALPQRLKMMPEVQIPSLWS